MCIRLKKEKKIEEELEDLAREDDVNTNRW